MGDNINEENEKIEEEVVMTGNDTVKISNDVVATYAGIAVSEVEGVYGMAGGFAGITEVFAERKI